MRVVEIQGGFGLDRLAVTDRPTPEAGAGQVGAGIAFGISDSTALTLDYRFFATADPDFNNLKTEYMRHDARLGLRFRF